MKEIKKDKVCYYCYGCNLLEFESFEGKRNCKELIARRDMTEFYKLMKEGNKKEIYNKRHSTF